MKILVIGDACQDVYHYGDVRRLNPEAPVPIITIHHTEYREGMSGNVHNNLMALGAWAHRHAPDSPSIKTRYIDKKSGYQLLRVDEDIEYQPYEVQPQYSCDAIVVSDYNKGYVTVDTITALASRFGGPIYVDSKKPYLPSLPNVYYKINEIEYGQLVHTPVNLVVTMGANGCVYNGRTYPAPRVEVVDVCGAGDVFLAAMAYYHMKFGEMGVALDLANRCAATSCRHVGCYTLTDDDLKFDLA